MRIRFCLMIIALLAAARGNCEEAAVLSAPKSAWAFSLSTEGWFPASVYWRTRTRLGSVQKQYELNDVLKAYRGGGFLSGEARKCRWGFQLNVNYGYLRDNKNATFTSFLPNANLPVDDTIRCGIVEADVCYRLGNERLNVDVLAGVHYLPIQAHFAIKSGYVDVDKHFVEPVIGGIAHYRIADKWQLMAQARVSGFGIGAVFCSDIGGRITYAVSKHAEVFLGYRFWGTIYNEDAGGVVSPGIGRYAVPGMMYEKIRLHVNCAVQGPTAGITWRW